MAAMSGSGGLPPIILPIIADLSSLSEAFSTATEIVDKFYAQSKDAMGRTAIAMDGALSKVDALGEGFLKAAIDSRAGMDLILESIGALELNEEQLAKLQMQLTNEVVISEAKDLATRFQNNKEYLTKLGIDYTAFNEEQVQGLVNRYKEQEALLVQIDAAAEASAKTQADALELENKAYQKHLEWVKETDDQIVNSAIASVQKQIDAYTRLADSQIAEAEKASAAIISAQKKAADDSLIQSKKIETNFVNTGRTIATVGRSMNYSLTLPLLAIGYESVKQADTVGQSYQKIASLTNVPASAMDGLKKSIVALSDQYAVAQTDAADTYYVIASDGLKGQKAQDALNVSLEAQAVHLGKSSDIARLVAGAMNDYSKSGLTAAQAGNVLAQAVKQGNMDTTQLGVALTNVTPFAATAGVSFNQVAAALAVTSKAGLSMTTAAAGLRGMFIGLDKDSKTTDKGLAAVGLTIGQLRDTMAQPNGLLKTFDLLKEKTNGNVSELAKIFPQARSLSDVLTILGQSNKVVATTFNAVTGNGNALNDAFKTTSETAQFKMQKALNDVKNALAEIGAAIMPVVTNLLNLADKFLQFFNGLGDGWKTFIIYVGLAAAAMGPLVYAVGGVIEAFGTLFTTVKKVGDFFASGWTNLDKYLAQKAAANESAVALEDVGLAAQNTSATTSAACEEMEAAYLKVQASIERMAAQMTASGATAEEVAAQVQAATEQMDAAFASVNAAVTELDVQMQTIGPAVDAAAAEVAVASTEMEVSLSAALGPIGLLIGGFIALGIAADAAWNASAGSLQAANNAAADAPGSTVTNSQYALRSAGRDAAAIGPEITSNLGKAGSQLAGGVTGIAGGHAQGMFTPEGLRAQQKALNAYNEAQSQADLAKAQDNLRKLQNQTSSAVSPTGGGAAKVPQSIKDYASQLDSSITSVKNKTVSALGSLQSLTQKVNDGFTGLNATGGKTDLPTAITKAFGSTGSVDSAMNQFDSLMKKLDAAAPKEKETLKNLVQNSIDLMSQDDAINAAIQEHQRALQETLQGITDKYDPLEQAAQNNIDSIKKHFDDLIPTLQTAYDDAKTAFDAQNAVLNQMVTAQKNAMDAINTSLTGYMDSTTLDQRARTFVRSMELRLQDVKTFTANIQKLLAEGLDPTLVQQFIQAGPASAGAAVNELAGASADTIAHVNDMQSQLTTQITSFQKTVSAQYYDAGIAQQQAIVAPLQTAMDTAKSLLDTQKQLYQDQLLAAQQSLLDLQQARKTETDAANKDFKDFSDSMNKQITANQKALNDNANAINNQVTLMATNLAITTAAGGMNAITGLINGMADKGLTDKMKQKAYDMGNLARSSIEAGILGTNIPSTPEGYSAILAPVQPHLATSLPTGGTVNNITVNATNIADPMALSNEIAWAIKTGAGV